MRSTLSLHSLDETVVDREGGGQQWMLSYAHSLRQMHIVDAATLSLFDFHRTPRAQTVFETKAICEMDMVHTLTTRMVSPR